MKRTGAASLLPFESIFTVKELLAAALIAVKHTWHAQRAAILVPPTMGPSALLAEDEIVFGGIPDHHPFREAAIVHDGVPLGTLLIDREVPAAASPLLESLAEQLYRHSIASDLKRIAGKTDALLVGTDGAFRRAVGALECYAGLQEPVLLTGESGSGKELFAMALHVRSGRKTMPCVSCNCAAIPNQDLLLSELFGHERGAFTGAVRAHQGKVEQASDGTLFLDEIGDLSLEGQAAILRVLESGEFSPLGSERPRFANIRLISATHQNLQELIRRKRFREDLYYRIASFTIQIPPLRERREDIPILADYLLFRFARDNGRESKTLAPGAVRRLKQHPFPGNVRELDIMLKKAFVSSRGSEIPEEAIPEASAPADAPGGLEGWALAVYSAMVDSKVPFWTAVKAPYLRRHLNRDQMWAIVNRGLEASGGSYQALVRHFNLPDEDYPRFIAFLNRNKP